MSMLPIANTVQQTFDGWNEFAFASFAALQIQDCQLSSEPIKEDLITLEQTLLEPNGPYQTLPWTLNLTLP